MNRRSFLGGSAALVAAPALGAPAARADFDVVIVGAGAAGIAAARRLAKGGYKFVILEAGDRWGGRCFTDTRTFPIAYERGARLIYAPDANPIAKVAAELGFDISTAPPGQRLRVGHRNAREGEMEEFFSNLVRCSRAISDAAAGKVDVSCAQALPKDLGGDWRPTMEFVLGGFRCGKSLSEISAVDFARSGERDVAALSRQGLGPLLSKLAFKSPTQFFSPVTRIEWGGRVVEAEARGSVLTARTAIVTASTGVLGSGKIKFQPALPARHAEAIGKLGLGSYERVAIEFAGNPLGLQSDDFVFQKAADANTAALLANVSGSRVCMVEIAGKLAANLAADGEGAMTAFAVDWLIGLFGSDLKRAVKRTQATRWAKEPWVLGAFSAAAPGAAGARKALSEPVGGHLWFAGEAVHETLWGTLAGAWEAGERAADAAIKKLTGRP
ncbi:MAG TPA: FAD-dependent oxidoreductase [Xanthobacteraceae bacterium]